MAHEFTEHINYQDLPKPPDEVHAFYIEFDLDDNGKLVQKKDEFNDELFNDLIPFAFGDRNRVVKNLDYAKFSEMRREAARRIYQIPEAKDLVDDYESAHKISDSYLRRGEFGELVLYHLLHEYFNAESLISKIYFKDNDNLPAHGFDAVHVDSKSKTLWLGESKLYEQPNQAIDALIQDLKEHFNRDFFHSEFQIITNRAINDSNIPVDPFIQRLLDPKTKILDKLANINVALFAAYDSSAITSEQQANMEEKLEKETKRLYKKIRKGISKHAWNKQLKTFLLLFPLDSKKEFVKKLHVKLIAAQRS